MPAMRREVDVETNSEPGIRELLDRMARVEVAMQSLVERATVKDWYSTDEIGRTLGKTEFTVREWCRLSRIHAERRRSGRGKHQAWVVSHAELLRYRREGLLPLPQRVSA